jgi:hypothetical protein
MLLGEYGFCPADGEVIFSPDIEGDTCELGEGP